MVVFFKKQQNWGPKWQVDLGKLATVTNSTKKKLSNPRRTHLKFPQLNSRLPQNMEFWDEHENLTTAFRAFEFGPSSNIIVARAIKGIVKMYAAITDDSEIMRPKYNKMNQ